MRAWLCKIGIHNWKFIHYDGYCWVKQCDCCGKRISGWSFY